MEKYVLLNQKRIPDFKKKDWKCLGKEILKNCFLSTEKESGQISDLQSFGLINIIHENEFVLLSVLEKVFEDDKGKKILLIGEGVTNLLPSICNLMSNSDFIVINDSKKANFPILKQSLNSFSLKNCVVSNQDPELFTDLELFFDLVIFANNQSNNDVVAKLKDDNLKRALQSAAYLVTGNGHLVTYFTDPVTSFDTNKFITDRFEFKELEIKTNISVFIKTGNETSVFKAKIDLNRLPQAKVELLKEWIAPRHFKEYQYFLKNDGGVIAIPLEHISTFGAALKTINKSTSCFDIGYFKGLEFQPSHSLAISDILHDSVFKQKVIEFEKIEDINSLLKFPEGYTLIQYKSINVGWIKREGDSIKKLF